MQYNLSFLFLFVSAAKLEILNIITLNVIILRSDASYVTISRSHNPTLLELTLD